MKSNCGQNGRWGEKWHRPTATPIHTRCPALARCVSTVASGSPRRGRRRTISGSPPRRWRPAVSRSGKGGVWLWPCGAKSGRSSGFGKSWPTPRPRATGLSCWTRWWASWPGWTPTRHSWDTAQPWGQPTPPSDAPGGNADPVGRQLSPVAGRRRSPAHDTARGSLTGEVQGGPVRFAEVWPGSDWSDRPWRKLAESWPKVGRRLAKVGRRWRYPRARQATH